MKKKIRVTREDIRLGKRDLGYECPVARALKSATGERWFADTDVCKSGTRPIETPERVTRFIDNFDRGAVVRPFTFTIDLPAPGRRK